MTTTVTVSLMTPLRKDHKQEIRPKGEYDLPEGGGSTKKRVCSWSDALHIELADGKHTRLWISTAAYVLVIRSRALQGW